MNSIAIHVVSEDAAPIVAQILLRAFEKLRPQYTDGGFAATTPSAPQILVRLKEGPVWLATYDNEPVGTTSAVVRGTRTYMRGMAVLPSARGRGVGSALLQKVQEYASGQGSDAIYLSTTPFLLDAIQLYERFGFQKTVEGPHDLCGTPLFTMEKKLVR